MALEDQIEKLIESNAALSAAINEQNRLTSIIVGSMKNAPVVKAAETTGPAPQDEDEAPAKPAARGRKPAAEKAAPAAKPAAKKAPTGAELGKLGTEFLEEAEDDDEYDIRAKLVKAMLATHERHIDEDVEKPRLRDINNEAARQRVADALIAYRAGDPTGYKAFDGRDAA